MVTQITRDGGHCQPNSAGFADAAAIPLQRPTRVDGAYLHVPFCFHKCHYCDFYSLVDGAGQDRRGAFTDRLIAEIELAGPGLAGPLGTVYVGGGTPTLLTPGQWSRLLESIHGRLPLAADAEMTVEANPETVTAELMETLAAGGVNRLSIGAQSFDARHLRSLERHHDPANVSRAIDLARSAGIRSINLDLIFAIPGQTPEDWGADLDRALALEPDHLSCYALTYEPNTPLAVKRRSGLIEPALESDEAAMYGHVIDRLEAVGFDHYEVSAWARPGHRCRHNLLYWTNRPWWPFGPSAAGHVDGWRWKNVPRLSDYLQRPAWPAIEQVERLDEDGRIGETLMLGLRLLEGIAVAALDELLERGERASARRDAIARRLDEGLLRKTGGRLSLTAEGLMLADSVIAELL